MSLFKRKKAQGKKEPEKPKSEFIQFVEQISNVPNTGWVKVYTPKGMYTFDYYAPIPTEEILKEYVKSLKIKGVTKAEFVKK